MTEIPSRIIWAIGNWSFEFVWNLGFEIWNLRQRLRSESEEGYHSIVGDVDICGKLCQEG
jgi:hypothetical protein